MTGVAEGLAVPRFRGRHRWVCMVVHAYYPLAEPRVQREARAAADAGFHVTVVALQGEGEAANEVVDGIEVRRVGIRHERGASVWRTLREYLGFMAVGTLWLGRWSLRAPPDIVHVHTPPDFLVLAGLVPRLRGSRLILDIHDLSSHMSGARISGRGARSVARLLVWIERLACALAHDVITVHAPYRGELVKHGVLESKITVIMNSVDEAVLERARASSPLVSATEGYRLAYHGTITRWYGVDLLIDAVAGLRKEGVPAEAVILGDGDALPALRSQVARAGLEEAVRFSGRYLPIEVVLATVAGSNCGVIPNLPSDINRFALSSKLFEYVALGVPVVVARLETLAAYFASDEVTFFEPGDVESLRAAIAWVCKHPDEAGAKTRRAQARAKRYSWARSREELICLYAKSRPATAPG